MCGVSVVMSGPRASCWRGGVAVCGAGVFRRNDPESFEMHIV